MAWELSAPRKFLGQGADAVVFLDQRSNVVVKHHMVVSTYLRELEALRKLQADEVVRLCSFCISDRVLYLESHDCDLLQYLSHDVTLLNPYERAHFQYRVCLDLMRALWKCHEARIAHNDVKLENILITKQPLRVVLADFGRASVLDGECASQTPLKGTRIYMAPEVFEDRSCLKSDCWSAGVVCFACIERQMPFEEDDESGPLVYELAERQQRWPTWAEELVEGLLKIDPGQRLTSAEAASLLGRGAYEGPQETIPSLS